MATKDTPGEIPGDGWMKLATRGRAEKGERGATGLRGPKGGPVARVEEWGLSRERYAVVPFYTDGSAGTPLQLLPLFEQYHTESRD